jgi:hypothetical protein
VECPLCGQAAALVENDGSNRAGYLGLFGSEVDLLANAFQATTSG